MDMRKREAQSERERERERDNKCCSERETEIKREKR